MKQIQFLLISLRQFIYDSERKWEGKGQNQGTGKAFKICLQFV